MFTETNFIRQKLFDIEMIGIDVFEVDDGEYSSRTGIVPITEIKSEYDEGVSEGQSLGIQKKLGSHPGAGKILHWGEDSGFMTFLLANLPTILS